VNNTANTAEAVQHFIQRRVLHIVLASTSGHTAYVVDTLIDSLKSLTCACQKSSPSILVMQSTQDRTAQNAPRCLGGT
jgi:hypothetical protein